MLFFIETGKLWRLSLHGISGPAQSVQHNNWLFSGSNSPDFLRQSLHCLLGQVFKSLTIIWITNEYAKCDMLLQWMQYFTPQQLHPVSCLVVILHKRYQRRPQCLGVWYTIHVFLVKIPIIAVVRLKSTINKQYFKLRKNIFFLILSLTFKNISGIYNDF